MSYGAFLMSKRRVREAATAVRDAPRQEGALRLLLWGWENMSMSRLRTIMELQDCIA